MPELSVDAHLGATICVDEENRSYVKLDISINGIDPYGDVEAQTKLGVDTGKVTITLLNGELTEVLSDSISLVDNPTLLIDRLSSAEDRLEKIESVQAKVVTRVRSIIAKLTSGSEASATSPEAASETPPKTKKDKKGAANAE